MTPYLKEAWKASSVKAIEKDTGEAFRKHAITGRPMGEDDLIENVDNIPAMPMNKRG